MNTKNNKRRRESRKKIEEAFIGLLQSRELNSITVSELCKITGLNRSTFYANYADIYELADTIRATLEENLNELYHDEITSGYNSNNYLRLFQHIYHNQLFYQTYFKLGYDNQYEIDLYDTVLAKKHFSNQQVTYHAQFFKGGITAIIKIWLENGCRETPEEMYEIIRSEYRGREEILSHEYT